MAGPISVARSPGMPALLLVSFAGFSGYAALLSVAPLWVVRGGAGEVGAGLVNAVLLAATVAAQPFVPWALRRFGLGPTVAAGLVLLGLPALGLGLSDALAPVLVLSAVRGVGFAVLTVTGSATVALLVAPDRLGAAIGIYGLGISLPMLVLLPVAVPIADALGFWAVFGLAALPLLGLPATAALGRAVRRHARTAPPATGPAGSRLALLRRVWPAMVILLSVTLTGGAIMTFLPMLVSSGAVAALILFLLSLAAAVSRWAAGGLADRAGPRPFLVPLLVLTAAGMAGVAWWLHAAAPTWVLAVAIAVIGLGYGALQNLTLLVAFQAVERRQVNPASAAWNMGFDAGTGLGSLATGYLAAGFSFPVAFGVLAVVCVGATVAVRAVDARPAR